MDEFATPSSEPRETRSPRQLIDERDIENLAALAELYEVVDPLPEGLVERLSFGLALDAMMAEVAQLTRIPADAMAVRGETSAPSRTETITFTADALTAMLTVVRLPRDRVRVDGWIAPAAVMRVRLRMQGERRQVSTDESGRFSFDDLPGGFVQFTFHPDDDESDAVVVTPLFEL